MHNDAAARTRVPPSTHASPHPAPSRERIRWRKKAPPILLGFMAHVKGLMEGRKEVGTAGSRGGLLCQCSTCLVPGSWPHVTGS